MVGETWVLVEQWRGRISETPFEGPGPGRGAAAGVLVADHAALAEPVPEVCALALAQLLEERRPEALLIPQTNVTMEIGSLLAARMKLPSVNFSRDVQVAGGRLGGRCV